jgi:hypothetical protein
MTIVDQTGAVVLSLSVQAGQPTVTANVYLKQGTYSVRYSGYTTDNSAWNNLSYQLSGGEFSDPVGAYPTSPSSPSSPPPSSSTQPPPSPSSPPPSSYSPSGSSSSTSNTYPSSPPRYY